MSAVDFRRAPERDDHVRAALLNKVSPVAEARDSTMGSRPRQDFGRDFLQLCTSRDGEPRRGRCAAIVICCKIVVL